MSQSELGYWLVVVVFAAVLAALMSTADSALLSISSMFTRDIYRPYFRPDSNEEELTHVGKVASWIIIALLVWVAIGVDQTLVRLLELKFEILIQVVPCFFLGLYWQRLSAQTALTGMLVGLGIALGLTGAGRLGLTWAGQPLVWGFHAGVIGLFANIGICALGAWLVPASKNEAS